MEQFSLRSRNPWKIFAQPILKSYEHQQFESEKIARVTKFEFVHFWSLRIEKQVDCELAYSFNIIQPTLAISIASAKLDFFGTT